MKRPLYQHTQAGWPIRVAFFGLAVGLLVMASASPIADIRAPPVILIAGAVVSALLGWVWGALTVRIEQGQLFLRFGLGWPRKTVSLASVEKVEVTRTTFRDGWGVHRTARGWLYNVAGHDAVQLHLSDGRSLLIGSDEPRRLRSAIERARAMGAP